MKLRLCTILMCMLPQIAFTQTKELIKRIDLYKTLQRLDYEKKYDSIIAVTANLPSRDSVYLYAIEDFVAKAYLTKGDTARFTQYLTKAIENQSIKALENLQYSYKEYKLDNNKTYEYIVQHFDEINSKYESRLNLPMLKECLEIYYTDSRMRWLWMGTANDTLMQRLADSLQSRSDHMNIESMNQIFRKYGRYPGLSDIGAGLMLDFRHIIAHFAALLNQDTLYSFLRTATLKGQIPNWYGPFILDKVEFYAGRPLIYGEFGNANNYKDGTYYYSDIRDIEYVDKRHAEFLLPPLYKEPETKKCVLPKGYDRFTQKH